MMVLVCILLLLSRLIPFYSYINLYHLNGYRYYSRNHKLSSSYSQVKNNKDNSDNTNIFSKIQDRLSKLTNINRKDDNDKLKDDNTLMVEFIDYKPWLSYKIKNLNIHYKPYQNNWEERFRTNDDDDTIYLYSIPKIR